jgi:peptidoglycan L-alanyl-D-glutamate endopeptidase CwlK
MLGKIYGLQKLAHVDPRLADIVRELGRYVDGVQVVCGHRGKEDQDKAFAERKSKVKWPKSKHNSLPARAVDLALVRRGAIDWNASQDWYYIAGLIRVIASQKGVEVRWGGDWDGDGDFKEEKFKDLPHFELRV